MNIQKHKMKWINIFNQAVKAYEQIKQPNSMNENN